MGRLFLPRTAATEYAPIAGDTLEKIVKDKCEVAEPPITGDEVALFNWGTKEPREVLRALVELLGCKKADEAAPYKSELDPALGPGGGKVLLPKLWKKPALAFEKVHTLKVKQQLPATAVSITSLDKWFLPSEETCEAKYKLEGIKARALKVDVNVYASNYCKAAATNEAEFVKYVYSDIPDIPILKKSVEANAAERGDGELAGWKGESEAAEGVLKPRGPAKRYANAASSPYTVMVRYYKDAAHDKAMLRMASFWPQWSGAGVSRAVVADSLKFKYTLKDCPGAMQGQFQIFDKDGKIVWRQALKPAECGNGEHTIDWSQGSTVVKEDQMPYRAQVQVHTDKDTEPGLGLAAMHTEVRIFTHKDIGTHGVNHELEPQALTFAIAHYWPGVAPAEDSAKGRKLRLAKAGYHPGPVADNEAQAVYLKAIKEFQRDHKKTGTHDRLRNDGTIDADTKTAIAALAAGGRPLFGDPANRSNLADDAAKIALNDKDKSMIVWVDDRHCYTSNAVPSATNGFYTNMNLGDYRGGMGLGDAKQTTDASTICRPYIPVQTSLPILRKGDTLTGTTVPAVNEHSRHATGPIRVDWTFRDLPAADNVDTSMYLAIRARPKQFLTSTFTARKGTHNGKDAFNCEDTVGGLRGAAYHKAPFGIDDQSLVPWKAQEDAGVKAVLSVAHDDLGQDADRVYAHVLGNVGAYLNPSMIAGDGYQFRAQVSFADLPSGSTHPNWKVLKTRYSLTQLPQAHTGAMRLWRKTSLKGFLPWEPNADRHWGGAFNFESAFLKWYEPAFVHFVHEGGTQQIITPSELFPGATSQADYRTFMVAVTLGTRGANPKIHKYRPQAEITLSPDYVWPYSGAVHLGVQGVPPPGTTFDQFESAQMDGVWDDTWRKYRAPLIHLSIQRIEQAHSKMRGHMIGEFRASPPYWLEKYYCDTCNTDQILIELTAGGASGVGEDCRAPTCAGHLRENERHTYKCDAVGCTRTVVKPVWQGLAGQSCTRRCTGHLAVTSQENIFKRNITATQTGYRCPVCLRAFNVMEAAGTSGDRAGTACNAPCTGHFVDMGVAFAREITAASENMLGLPAAGEAMGGLWLFCTYPRGVSTWAHEIGHHKHLEHGPGGGGYILAHHDSQANPNPPVSTATNPINRNWDRVCIMGYTRTGLNLADPDRGYFCGRCILKLRGWKVQGLALPASGSGGP